MQGYQKYQKYQKSSNFKGNKALKYIIFIAIGAVLFFILKAIFGTSSEVTIKYPDDINPNVTNSNTEEIGTLNENTNSNTNTNSNENSNTNSNTNTNSNSNTNVDSSVAAAFDIDNCDQVYSRGSASDKKVTLTFNVGTTKEGDIDKLLTALKDSGTTADFFARGDVAEENNAIIKKISDAGLAVYNLSYDHPKFNSLTEDEIIQELSDADSQISQITGKSTKPFFRPPYGEADDEVVGVVTGEGYCPVTWTVDALDWSSDYTAEASKDRVISNVANGAIILMQASNSTTAIIVPQIISELKDSGYQFVNLNDLL